MQPTGIFMYGLVAPVSIKFDLTALKWELTCKDSVSCRQMVFEDHFRGGGGIKEYLWKHFKFCFFIMVGEQNILTELLFLPYMKYQFLKN